MDIRTSFRWFPRATARTTTYQSNPLAEFQIDGTKTPLTYSETVLDDYSVNVIAKFNGRVINKGVRRVSADGKTMKIDVVAIDQNGTEHPLSLVFLQSDRLARSRPFCKLDRRDARPSLR